MKAKINDIDLPDRPEHSPTEALIGHHLRQMGCHLWGKSKFLRLARALNETPYELGARIGLSRWELKRRFETNQFRTCEGLLLELHWRFIESITTGLPTEGNLFYTVHHDRLQNPKVEGPHK